MSIVAASLALLFPQSTPSQSPLPQPKPIPLVGFSPVGSVRERELETKFDAAINAGDLRGWMKRLSARPHHVGSPYGLENANFMLKLYESFGLQAHIETFTVLFPSPRTRILTMGMFKAKLTEPPIVGDTSARLTAEELPPYNAYSRDGDVRGKLVYVNFGMPADYEELEKRGIEVKGKIVIARYGGGWRGIKPKVAAEHGAIGCLIYSDPKDDGYFQGDVYPQGGYRNEDSVQRGSIADMPVYPGDPLTPGIGATKDAKRLAVTEAPTITKIPTLPISYGDAIPLLKDLTGPVAPEAWRGALPLTYHIGPGKSTVRLKVEFDWQLVEARDVIAILPGTDLKDQWVIRGNHHDAWVCGADDPLSGQVAMLSEAKALGALAKNGWKPKRTIVYCSWDGEEPGLLGSTEWVETHAEELSQKAVAYINSDSNSRGFFGVGGSHSLEPFMNGIMRDVPDAEAPMSIGARLRARAIVTGAAEEKKKARSADDLAISPLGSGSDYSPFLQHIGVASLNFGFGGEGEGNQYHSAYDTFEWFTRFLDPDYAYGVLLAKTGGRAVLRMANADSLPMDYGRFATVVEKYAKEVVALVDEMRQKTDDLNASIADGSLAASFDPRDKNIIPVPKAAVPKVDLKPLLDAVARLKEAAKNSRPNDAKLIQCERALLGPGLPRRTWYRHTIYAPGFYTGYGVKTLPGIREAIEQRNWPEAEEQAKIAAESLDKLAALLRN
ncbi:transferrin receptor-like dimerization domain-containing protein [Fimbriimonas ginsengisoli]|uniref:Folate hydrolase-like protein n=1 Tax=Fimbriimonas ginsengisoli Gsoil 348 TaxID=661478 RepID=A0A068NS34_FIMGI|nr:transferrin receptor-like dimerization domain-containing protein [Fimbriimonas ginsengisoli]AIE86368.1 folate hydrolase-like protein [Fimbriimonas ginsengisoli Gsoil 348]